MVNFLQNGEIVISQCFDIAVANIQTAKKSFDLLILDVNLPDGNGLVFLRKLLQAQNVSAILLTANDLELDIVTGLELGADDYITKPFSLALLRARVNTQLCKQAGAITQKYIQDALSFDFDRMEY